MKKYILISLVFIVGFVSAQKTPEAMRAEYLLYIIKQVEWVNEKDISIFKIGVLGNEEGIYNELLKQSEGLKTINNKPIEIVRYNDIADIKDVQIIYVNKKDGFEIGKVVLQTTGKNILIVSENYEFQKSMINFIIVDGVLRFEMNKKRIESEGLYAKPLFAAKAIRDKADWEKLYIKTEQQLEKTKVVVEAQTKQIEEQKAEIEKQKKEIAEQEKKIQKQKQEIEIQQNKIDKQKKELTNLIVNVNIQKKLLKEKMALLEEQQEKLDKQKHEIEERNKKLQDQKISIEAQENKINEQKKVLNDQLEKIEAQRLIMYLFIIVIFMISGLGYFIYRSYRIKKKANIMLEEKNSIILARNEEIMQQKEEIEAQRDEIEEQRDRLKVQNEEIMQAKEEIEAQRDEIERQRDIAEMQRDEIIEQKREITDSILYARRIQTAILPPREYIGESLRQYFILNKPRDIVSGDYYWITEKEDKIIVAAADCTGHGVPGAFMSMLGVALLNQIVGDDIEIKANEILNQLRTEVINSLRQTGKEGEAKDGMDIALCVIDFKKNELQYSGANNPLYLLSKKDPDKDYEMMTDEHGHNILTNDDYLLTEYKADKMPIGIYFADKPFTNNLISIKKGDTIYIFSDGYADQFGGPNGKKFKYKPFKELILSIQPHLMHDQETILDDKIEKWKGEHEQVDDILIIGVRI